MQEFMKVTNLLDKFYWYLTIIWWFNFIVLCAHKSLLFLITPNIIVNRIQRESPGVDSLVIQANVVHKNLFWCLRPSTEP